jgi:hypothetical protein
MADETKTAPAPKIDAVICHADYPHFGDYYSKAHARNREFGPLLGCKSVASRNLPGDRSLLSGDPGQVTIVHPTNHRKAGQARYDWHDRGDGVMYGVLLPDEDVAKSEELKTVDALKAGKANLEKKIADLKAIDPAKRSADQAAELAKAEAWHERLHGGEPKTEPEEAATAHE